MHKPNKLPIKEKAAVGVLLAMLLTNPLTGQYVLGALDWVFQQMFFYGAYVGIVGTLYLIGLGGFYYVKLNRVEIPVKSKKKTEKYIDYA